MTEPYISGASGDILKAGTWNEMQVKIREALNQHTHSGEADQGPELTGTAFNEKSSLSVSSMKISGDVGIGTENPGAKLHINGDLKLEKGVAVNEFSDETDIKNPGSDLKVPTQKAVKGYVDAQITALSTKDVTFNGDLSFGDDARQMINLSAKTHGIGVQLDTQYFRTDKNFAWYKGGSHKDDALDAGGGTAEMIMKDGKLGIGVASPAVKLDVNGSIKAKTVRMTNPMIHRMYPSDPLIYQDIFEAVKAGKIMKLGSPSYNDTSYTASNKWYGHPIISYGGNAETDGNGAKVIIPDGYDTVWVRLLGERWNAIHAYFLDGDDEDLGVFTGGYRSANCYCPDGSLSDSYQTKHQWLPIPATRSGELALISTTNTSSGLYVSGLAFSKNPWQHAAQSAVGLYWKSNGGDAAAWNSENSNNDVLGNINLSTNLLLKIPIIPTGAKTDHDRLLYLIEYNSNWNGCSHYRITVNDKKIERFLSTYDNPFARHWSSKINNRYIAARIPKEVIPENTRFLDVKINTHTQDTDIYFREMGTHNLDIPDN